MLPKIPLFTGEDTTVDTALMDSSVEDKGDHIAVTNKKVVRSKSTGATNVIPQVQDSNI